MKSGINKIIDKTETKLKTNDMLNKSSGFIKRIIQHASDSADNPSYSLFLFAANSATIDIMLALITVPVVSMLFIYLIVAIIFGSIFGIAVPLINIFVFGMKYVLQFNSFIASANWVISVKNVSEIVLLLSLVTIFIMSDYVFIKKKPKWIISSAMVCLIVCLMIF